MKKVLLAIAVLGLAACQTSTRSTDRISATPPANPTGSVGYQGSSTDPNVTTREAPPVNPTGSMGYQGSGGSADRTSAAPPRNPTGSVGYQR